MEIKLREIDRSSWEACCNLEVEESQKGFVAPNTFSLAQAAYEPDACPMGIWRDGVLVGFIMYDFDSELCSWGMCRLMVDKKYQRQGIGEAAVKKLLEWVRAKHGPVMFCTSAEPENVPAITLYEKLGFKKNGRIVYDEVMMEIQL
jgi:diamine N-acetyltransferase